MATLTIQVLKNGRFTALDDADSARANSLRIGTNASNTELTKTILDNLLLLQDGGEIADTYHTHDDIYFTETELGSTGATSGADLIGTNNTPSNYSPSSATVQDHLEAIDTALASAGGSAFQDDTFRIQDNGDNSKEIAFQASALTTSTTRTITMPDTDVDLADIATNTSNISSNDIDISDLVTLSGVAANSTDLGTFTGDTIADSRTIKQALQDLETELENTTSTINNFEWQESALDYVTNNTVAPATEVTGDRYILSHDGGIPHVDYDGASAGDIVEFNGTTWVATTPTTGTFIAADDEPNALYLWGGSSWSSKAFESTTASTGLTKVGVDIQLADQVAHTGATSVSSGLVTVEVDDSTIERASNAIQLKDDGITNVKINSAAGIETSKLADSTELSEAVTFFANTDLAGSEAETLSDGSFADSLHKHQNLYLDSVTNNTGSQINAGDVVLLSKSVSGEIIVADASAESTGVGLLAIADENIANTASGTVQIAGRRAVSQDASFSNLGDEVYLSETAGSTTQTAPTASGSVVYVLGWAISSTEIVIDREYRSTN